MLANALLQVHHIDKLPSVLDDGMVIVVDKEVRHPMRERETAVFVEADGRRDIARTNLQRVVGAAIVTLDKGDKGLAKPRP